MPTVAAKSAASNASVFALLLRHPLARPVVSSNPLVVVAAVLVVPFSRSLIDAELAGSLIIIITLVVVVVVVVVAR